MKFSEKLINLRKKEGLSQEELGEKLNVTRQTISKWELGQTTPELDKIKELSKIFNVSTDELIGVESNNKKEEIKVPKKKNKTRERAVLATLVVLLIICVGFLSYMGISSYRRHKENEAAEENNFFDKFFDGFDDFGSEHGISIDNGNLDFSYKGTVVGFHAKDAIDDIVALNNKGRNIEVLFNETLYKGDDIDSIRGLMITESSYNFQYEYKDKKIVKVIIKREYSDSEKHQHNGIFESLYSGRISGFFVKSVLNNVYKNNQKAEKKISVNYLGNDYTDNNEINNLQSSISSSYEYNVHYEYDTDGFINKAIIEKVN